MSHVLWYVLVLYHRASPVFDGAAVDPWYCAKVASGKSLVAAGSNVVYYFELFHTAEFFFYYCYYHVPVLKRGRVPFFFCLSCFVQLCAVYFTAAS